MENEKNNTELEELVDRAMVDVNNNNDENVEEVVEDTSKKEDIIPEFNGVFHERDSLSVNNIVDEVKTSFLEYSMSVITSRALPDLRDGYFLKSRISRAKSRIVRLNLCFEISKTARTESET